jgi:hypothetical protein
MYASLAMVIYLIGTGAGERPLVSLPVVLLFYIAAGAVSGTVVGLMRPMATRNIRGAMLVGCLAVFPVYFGGLVALLGFKALADVPGDIGVLIGSLCLGTLLGRLLFKRHQSTH